ncbi:sulfotransferase domain-containing protein [Pueribacillus sp. YX66]|uniref:sulfotransferase domain-containing protein n=1 Tax=Pueribacillus sp. YX66 TaxID=3229242 RepID=UPI00358D2023
MTNLAPFLMSSVPKSGTFFLHQLLTGMPNISMDITDPEKKIFSHWQLDPRNVYAEHKSRLRKLQKNEFGLGHIFYTPQYTQMLRQLNMKHIFIYRDPRDVLVSLNYFIKNKWIEHPFHERFQNPNMTSKERMLKLLHGEKETWPSFSVFISPFYGWINDPTPFAVSYEDLRKSEKFQRQTLLKLVQFLWKDTTPPCSYEQIVSNMIANQRPEQSATFRSGKIGDWKKEFDTELKETFKKEAGTLLVDYRFEDDYDW